jgi:vancomycin resistance protein YoaR
MGWRNRIVFLFKVCVSLTIGVMAASAILSPSNTYAAIEDEKIILIDQDKQYEYKLKDFSLLIINGNLLYCYDPHYLRYQLEKLKQELSKPPVDARIILNENKEPEIVAEIEGRELDTESLLVQLSNRSIYRESIILPFKKIVPDLMAEELADSIPTDLWSQYSTTMANYADRTENIKLAAKMIDGIIIAPGQEFSFNNTVGSREIENGYRPAKIIEGGSFVLGVGGGVCQVSSTLYNAVLLAGLTIKERHNHSISIAYVPLGRDATVVYQVKDLKFINNTPGYILLRTKVEGLSLTVSIYGAGEKPFDKIEIKNKIIKTYPYNKIYKKNKSTTTPTMTRKGQNGYLVVTWRTVTKKGQLYTEFISKDYFAPVNAIVSGNKKQQ